MIFKPPLNWMKGHAKLDEYEDIFIKGHEFIHEPIKRHLPLVYPEEIFIFQTCETLRLKKHEKILACTEK